MKNPRRQNLETSLTTKKLEIKIVSGRHWGRWCIVDNCEIYITVTFIRFSTIIQCVLSLQREFDFDSYANKTIFFTIMPCTYFKLWYVDKYIQTVRQANRKDAKMFEWKLHRYQHIVLFLIIYHFLCVFLEYDSVMLSYDSIPFDLCSTN